MNKIKSLMKIGLLSMLLVFRFVTSYASIPSQWLDYETGTLFEGLSYDESLWPTETFDVGHQNTEIEIDIKCAMIEPSYGYEGCIMWMIPTTGWINEVGKPQILERIYSYYMEPGYKSATLTILEEEYKDFDYTLQRALPPEIDNGKPVDPDEIPDITPYEGFYPTKTATLGFNVISGRLRTYVHLYPIAYDYEHQVVRAYTHIKLRVNHIKDEAGIEEVGADDAPAEYFNLQGIRVDKPEHGVYIERMGGKATKVVF